MVLCSSGEGKFITLLPKQCKPSVLLWIFRETYATSACGENIRNFATLPLVSETSGGVGRLWLMLP